MKRLRLQSAIRLALISTTLLPLAAAQAQVSLDASTEPAREIARDAATLETELRLPDRDRVDTALVFTNTGRERARVDCTAINRNGQRIGRIWLHVPPRGLRYALASDLSNGRHFVGSVECHAPSRVLGSAVLLAPLAMTDLRVQQLQGIGTILFPVAATY